MEGKGGRPEDEVQPVADTEAPASPTPVAGYTTAQLAGSASNLRRRTSRDGSDAGEFLQRATSSLARRHHQPDHTTSTISAGQETAGGEEPEESSLRQPGEPPSGTSLSGSADTMWNTRRRTDMADVLERRREAFLRGSGRSSASAGNALGGLLQRSLDLSGLRESLIAGQDGEAAVPSTPSSLMGSTPRPRASTEHVRFRLMRMDSWDSSDDEDQSTDDDADDAVRLSTMDLEQGSGKVRSRFMLSSSARQLPTMGESIPLLSRMRSRNRALPKDKASDSEDSDAFSSTSSSLSFSPQGSSTAVSTRHMTRSSLNYNTDDLSRSDGTA